VHFNGDEYRKAPMKRHHIYLLMLVSMLLPQVSFAVPVLDLDATGKLIGARNVDVGGTLYNVVFIDDSFSHRFVNAGGLDATSVEQASAFSSALLDSVLLDGTSGAFDANPALTSGCTIISQCLILTPYILDTQAGTVATRAAKNFSSLTHLALPDTVSSFSLNVSQDLGGSGDLVWADWSLAGPAIPEPSVLALLLVALPVFGWQYRKLQRV
jgi:hypothetical protein